MSTHLELTTNNINLLLVFLYIYIYNKCQLELKNIKKVKIERIID